jgi:SAM-dependent methyltransferase
LLAEDYAKASPDRLHQPSYERKYRDKQAEYGESSALQEAVRRCRDAGPLAVDLASGHGGGFLPWLAPRVRDGAILIGTDACLPVISNWSRLLSTYRDNVFFLDVDLLREPPFRNDMIDVFSGVMVANAYNSDPLKHFTRLHSRLRPGGILVISEIFYDAASKTAEFLADHSNPYQSLERFLGMLQSIGFHADDVLPLRRQQGKICSGDGFPIDDQDWWSEQIIVAART